MSDQDWAPVNVGKGSTITKQIQQGKLTKEIVEKKDGGKNNQLTSDLDPRTIENQEVGRLPTPNIELSTHIQQARMSKKLTQVQLNNMCNFPKGTIGKYENCSAVINSTELQAMSKVLGILLKKPKV